MCAMVEICRYRNHIKRKKKGGFYSPTEVQVIFEMPQLLFHLQRDANE